MKLTLPATSANIGCGYDTAGLALRLYNLYEFWETETDALLDSEEDPAEHLVFHAMHETQRLLAFPDKFATLRITADIPRARGLGSSAACVAAGIMMAFLLQGKSIDKNQVLSIGTKIEGHPDNVAPILYGGFTTALATEEGVHVHRFPVHGSIEPVLAVPRFPFGTQKARQAIPEQIAMADAVFNLSRLGLLIGALEEGAVEKLDVFARDRLHEPYRIPLILEEEGNFRRVREKMRTLLHGVSLSGAGPSLIGFTKDKQAAKTLEAWLDREALPYDVLSVGIEPNGYRLEM